MSFFLVLSILAATVALTIAIRWPRQRRQLLYGALFSLPIIGVEFLAAGKFDRFGSSLAQAIQYLVLLTVGVMSTGGVIAVVADVTVNRWLSPTSHQRRHRLGWLATGLVASGITWFFGWSLGLALLIGLLVNTVILWWLDWELLWDAVLGSVAFGAWFGLADIVFGIRSSGDIQRLLIGPNPLGLTFFGLPIERVLIGVMVGALVGPLYAATKFHRSPDVPRSSRVSTIKIVVGLLLTMVFTSLLAWTTSAYVIPPTITSIDPAINTQVAVNQAAITLTFTRPIDRQAPVITTTPPMDGDLEFHQPTFSDHGFRQARFVFETALQPGTSYVVNVQDVQSIWGLSSPTYRFQFTTTPVVAPPAIVPTPEPAPVPTPTSAPTPVPTPIPQPQTVPVATVTAGKTILVAIDYQDQPLSSVSIDYQDQPLSCEAAALKMALAGVGVKVTETQIMSIVGYDRTPHQGNVWGDPNVAFVGNIAGKQNSTGYGVYWGPIAAAAEHWRSVQIITNGTLSQLASEISAGHPVIIWGTIGRAYRDDWKTPNGTTILAWKGEHARTLIGFTGPVDHPKTFIINDPVAGRLTWTANTLDANWASFNRSGVIVK